MTRKFSLLKPIIAILVFPPTGAYALVSELRYRSSLRSQQGPVVKHAVRARDWASYSYGAALFCIIIALLIWFALTNDRAILSAYFDIPTIKETFRPIAKAFRNNLSVSIFAEIGILIWSLCLAVGRMLPGKAFVLVRFLAIAYVDLFRSLPSLLVILLIGFGLPSTGIPLFAGMSLYYTGMIALILVFGAYVSQIWRGAIDAIPQGQFAAARALGFSFFGAMRYIILPQAIRIAIPELLNWYIVVLKETSLLSVIGLIEGLTMARMQIIHLSSASPLIGIGICFMVVTLPLSRFTDYIIVRSQNQRLGKV